jgi:hypothetical protein
MRYHFGPDTGAPRRHLNAPMYTSALVCRTGWGTKAWKVRHSDDWSDRWLESCSLEEANDATEYGRPMVMRACCSFCLEYPVTTDSALYCSKECSARNAAVSRWSDKTLTLAAA